VFALPLFGLATRMARLARRYQAAFDFAFRRRVHSTALAMLKSASGAHTMPSLNRLTALATTLLLSLAPFAAAAQERTQEKETETSASNL